MSVQIKGTIGEFVFTIEDTESLSAAVFLGGAAIKFLAIPAGFEGTHLRFYREVKGVNYPCYAEDGTLITVEVATAHCIELNAALLAGSRWILIQACSAADGTPQVQTGNATVIIGTV